MGTGRGPAPCSTRRTSIAAHIRTARLLECQQKASAVAVALQHLSDAEALLVGLANEGQPKQEELFVLVGASGGPAARGPRRSRTAAAADTHRSPTGFL